MITTKVEPNYNRQKAIEYLERWFDDWVGDEDWWGGTDTWDINVFTDRDWEYGHWDVSIFGLEQDEEGFLHTRTETELDCFGFGLTKGNKRMKEYYFKIESTGIIDAESLVEAEEYVRENALGLINDDERWLDIHVEPEDYENFDEIKEV